SPSTSRNSTIGWFVGSSTRTPTTLTSRTLYLRRSRLSGSSFLERYTHPGPDCAPQSVLKAVSALVLPRSGNGGTDPPAIPDRGCHAQRIGPVAGQDRAGSPLGRGPATNTSRNLPICTSSPLLSVAASTRSRLT